MQDPIPLPDIDEQATLVTEALDAAELDWDEVGERRWTTMLSGEWKRTIPLLLDLDDRSLKVTSLLCGVPDEGHAEVYGIALHRNQHLGWVHFALDDEGDVVLTGRVPRAALDRRTFDEVLGQVLMVSDETFNAILRAGFASYIDAEQEWRAKNDMPPNPVSEAP